MGSVLWLPGRSGRLPFDAPSSSSYQPFQGRSSVRANTGLICDPNRIRQHILLERPQLPECSSEYRYFIHSRDSAIANPRCVRRAGPSRGIPATHVDAGLCSPSTFRRRARRPIAAGSSSGMAINRLDSHRGSMCIAWFASDPCGDILSFV